MARWKAVLGRDAVLLGDALAACWRDDTSASGRMPLAVLKIGDAGQLPQVLQIAQETGCRVQPVSTGSNWGYGTASPVHDDVVLIDLGGLTRILDFDPELGLVTLEPGVTQQMLADFLNAQGHAHMVPVTGAGPNVSVVANALERGYGVTPHADHFLAVTDVEAVLGDGSVYRSAMSEAGSPELARLFKWGIGPCMNGLFSQSGLGIVTRMSIVLLEQPEQVLACFFQLEDEAKLGRIVPVVQGLLKTVPAIVGGINLMNRHRVLSMVAPYPPATALDAEGLMHEADVLALGRQYGVAAWTGIVTLYGRARVVRAAQKREIRSELAGLVRGLRFLPPWKLRLLRRLCSWLPAGQGTRDRVRAVSGALELATGVPNETAMPLAYWRARVALPATPKDPARDRCGLLWYAPLLPMRARSVQA